MEERLLLDRITLHSTDISPGNKELPTAVVTNFADSGLALGNRATMPAGKATHTVAIKRFVQISLTDLFINDIAKSVHDGTYSNYRTPVSDVLTHPDEDA